MKKILIITVMIATNSVFAYLGDKDYTRTEVIEEIKAQGEEITSEGLKEIEKFFNECDLNKDDIITVKEFNAWHEKQGDTKAEYIASQKARATEEDREFKQYKAAYDFDKMDVDKNGILTFKERMDAMDKRLERSRKELETLLGSEELETLLGSD